MENSNPKSQLIDKEYLLTDNSVNSYGYRLLTEGYLLSEYEKNPIGYYMHLREDGVIVRWSDFRIDGDKVFAKPNINLSNTRGTQTVDEIVNGFLNAASVGHIVVIEISDDPNLKIPGQTGPTVTKWYNRESSLVDIPGNYNAITDLFDIDGNKIENLGAYANKKNAENKKDNPIKNDIENAPQKKDEIVPPRLTVLRNMSWDELDRSGTLKELRDLSVEDYEDKFHEQFGKYPDSRKERLNSNTKEADDIKEQERRKKRLDHLSAKSWDELDRSQDMAELKNLSEDAYKKKFFESFGSFPTN